MYIKGFDKDLKCRGFQFEVGGVYDTGYKKEELKLCSETVFHFCDSLEKVHEYYDCSNEENRYCEIEVLGELIYDENKCGSNKIRVVREIIGEELEILKGHKNGNTGLFNSGYRNSGDWNSGDRNSGYWNKCNGSNGVFCTIEPTIKIFDKDTNMTLEEFIKSKYNKALCSVELKLTEWIQYTEEEMKEDDDKKATKGYLKNYTYKEACANWWSELTEENKEIIMSISNFDADKFEEITGINIY